MQNTHSRWLSSPPEVVRAWIGRSWSGTDDDIFPRDVIGTWRKNPPGEDPQALVPGVTELGHGPFRFRLRRWDAERFEVEVVGGRITGWHGFSLVAEGGGTKVTHTLEIDGSAGARLGFALAIEPLHDWAVEAIFDRLEVAIANGAVPPLTERPISGHARLLLGVLRVSRWLRRKKAAH